MRDHRHLRGRFAQLMRAFYANRIGALDFDERAEEYLGEDRAVDQVFKVGAWCTYTDDRDEHFAGKNALTAEQKREIARWILFLKSDFSYDWPDYPSLPRWTAWIALLAPIPVALYFERWDVLALGFVASIFVFGLLDNIYARYKRPDFEKAGDFAVWPFISRSSYETALRNPPYFRGVGRRS